MRINKNTSTAALVGIWTVLLSAFIITVLYVGREILIPLALAAMITFLLSPLVARLERWIGRIAAVLITVAIIFGIIGGTGWLLTRQVIDLATKFPDYQTNIEAKLHSFRLPTGGVLGRLNRSVNELQKQLPAVADAPPGSAELAPGAKRALQASPTPMPVRVVDSQTHLPQIVQSVASGIVGPLGTAGLVILLVLFMLFKREDLRGRLIRLIGQGRIGATTRALDDAGKRVARYLGMQFLVNVSFGCCISLGLYFVGVPNALLWGAFAALMRFIPYVGAWIAAAVPLLLSFAVSSSWLAPILVLALFVSLELINANALEPWLYGASTGVSSIALIVSAVFWTWMWGPVGLLLSTPLTVCVAVMGRHVPRLQFLSVLLSEDEALAPHEEIYYRLLRLGLDDGTHLAETFAKTNSLIALYDKVLIPAITLAETDALRQQLDSEQRVTLQQHIYDMVEDLGSTVKTATELPNETSPEIPAPTGSILTLPARAYRDELAGIMLTQLLHEQVHHAENARAELSADATLELAQKGEWEAIFISVVAPSTHTHARFVCTRLRAVLPRTKIIVGIWGGLVPDEARERLRAAGADEIVVSLGEAIAQAASFCVNIEDEMTPAPIPPDESERLTALESLQILNSEPEENFDRMTEKVSRIFDVPIALITFLDRDTQWIKAGAGMPEDIAAHRSIPRAQSICGHIVVSAQPLIVEDLARDRRFANNQMLRERGLRFYAGVPLRVNDHVIGSLCILDTKPRRLTEREQRLLEIMADDVVAEIKSRVLAAPALA